MTKITRTDAEWAYMLSKDGWSYDALRDTWRREKDGKVDVGELRDGTFTYRTFSLHYPFVCEEAAPVTAEAWGKGYPAPPDVDWLNEVRTALRDQFAMCAMQALVNNDRISDPKGMALRAYEYADAMMIAREMKRG